MIEGGFGAAVTSVRPGDGAVDGLAGGGTLLALEPQTVEEHQVMVLGGPVDEPDHRTSPDVLHF